MSSVAVHGGILRQDAGVIQRFVNPGVVFEDAARHGRDEIDLQFELCQELMLDREDNAGFINETTWPPLWGNYNIEKQAADFYTREVFSKFQKLLTKSTCFGLQHQVQGDSIIFHLVANDGANRKVYVVRVDPEDERYMCSCNMFEMCGLICPHIIRVMVHLNVQTIPTTYMLERWSKRTTDVAPDPGDGHSDMHFGVPTTNRLKFNSLCRKFGKLASDACFSDEAYNFVSGLINQGIVGVAAMKARARDGVPPAGEAQGHEADQQVHASTGPVTGQQEPTPVGLRNPPKSAKKGRPKEKEKRRKPLIEIREDEMRKNAKKDGAKMKKAPKPRDKKTPCIFCGDEDHNAKSCKLLADMLAASAATKLSDVEMVLTL
ncbi:Protein FAR1-RELATED SEQUENCE 3 [Hordeum vulgare]|nr:Protein FAR1-RELATED SEQUENCE 3 [Hordeum vulgare]